MNPLALIPVKDWLYLGAIVALVGLAAFWTHHERQIGYTEGMNYVQARWDKAVEADKAALTAEVKRVATQDVKVDHATLQLTKADAAGALRADTAAGRVQQRFAALGACPMPGPAAPASAVVPADPAPDLRADVFGRVVEAARLLAATADARYTAGLDTTGRYQALSPVTSSSSATP